MKYENLITDINHLENDIQMTAAKPEDKSNNLAFDQKVLLSLSKILEGEDVCTAIMYDQDMQKLIIANNNANIDNYNAIIPALQKIAKFSLNNVQLSILDAGLDRVIGFILENKDSTLTNALKKNSIQFLHGDKDIHAEMQILEKLWVEKGGIFRNEENIVTSKLCCNCCQTTINIANQMFASQNLPGRIDTIGTHGKTYVNWKLPGELEEIFKDFLNNELLQQEKKLKEGYNLSEEERHKLGLHVRISDKPQALTNYNAVPLILPLTDKLKSNKIEELANELSAEKEKNKTQQTQFNVLTNEKQALQAQVNNLTQEKQNLVGQVKNLAQEK